MSRRDQASTADKPRSLFFHWVANVLFASLALFAGMLFGEKIPRNKLGMAFVAVCAVGLAMVPLTRRWERMGTAKRNAPPSGAPGAGKDKTRDKAGAEDKMLDTTDTRGDRGAVAEGEKKTTDEHDEKAGATSEDQGPSEDA